MAKKFTTKWTFDGEQFSTIMPDITTTTDQILKLIKRLIFINRQQLLSSRILKDAFMAIPQIITNLMNLSLSQNKFPTKWKSATIIPL